MLVIGLTGGIGSGKSTAAAMFADLGAPVIDTDAIARELVAPGQPALAAIEQAFGPEAVTEDGQLDRAFLRQRVFSDPAQRRRLEAVLHPRIRQRLAERVAALTAPYCIAVIPLLLEADMVDMVDRILVVDSPEADQVARIRQRDDVDQATLEGIMAAQVDRSTRLRAAHDIIHNDSDLAALRQQVAALHQRYLALAGVH